MQADFVEHEPHRWLGKPVAKSIRYHSTNRALRPGDASTSVSFRDALFQGLAPDGGLFMPDEIPSVSETELQGLRGRPYPEVAAAVLGLGHPSERGWGRIHTGATRRLARGHKRKPLKELVFAERWE